jgi:hypothetical protein
LPDSGSTGGATGGTEPTTDFSNIALKTHVPKEISDGAGGTLTVVFRGYDMGNSDASIVYELSASDSTYHLYRPDAAGPVELDSGTDLYSITVAGGGSKVLSHNGARDVIDYAAATTQAIGTVLGFKFPYTITDSGDLVAFNSRDDLTGDNVDGYNQIFTLSTDGSEIYNQITSFAADNIIENVHISGNGSKIFFTSSADVLADGSNVDGSDEIFSIDSSGAGLSQHTALDTGNVRELIVSSNGQVVATVITNYNGISTEALYALNSTTDVLSLVSDLQSAANGHDLSADGNKIVYTMQNVSTRDMMLVNSDGTAPVSVFTGTTSSFNSLSINTTGSQITFFSGFDFGKGVPAEESVTQVYTLTVN